MPSKYLAFVVVCTAFPLAMCQFDFDDINRRPSPQERSMRISASVLGICVEAIKCMDEFSEDLQRNMQSSMRKLSEKYDRRELQKLGPAAILYDPDFIDVLCDMQQKVNAQCVSQCPPEDGSLYKTLTVSSDMICNERRDDMKAAMPCYAKIFPKVQEGECWGKCGSPESVFKKWARKFESIMEDPPPLKEMAGMLVGDNGVLGTMCSFGLCMLTCFEDLSESVCDDRDHGELLRDVVEATMREAYTLVSDLNLSCLVPGTCYELAGAPSSDTWWIVLICVIAVLLLLVIAALVVFFVLRRRRPKTAPYEVSYDKE